MLNRVIYDGKVYYKVTDLRFLFDLTQYKLRKILKEQSIEITKLKGFGRSLFVLEENVAKIEVNDEFTIIETKFEDSIDKKTVKKTDETPAKKSQVKKSKKKSKIKIDIKKTVGDKKIESNINQIKRAQSELETSIKIGKQYALIFIKAGKMPLANEICDKHLAKANFCKMLLLKIWSKCGHLLKS